MASYKLQFTVKIGGLCYSSPDGLVDFAMMEDRVRGEFHDTVHCQDWWTLPWWRTGSVASSKLQFTVKIGRLCHNGGLSTWQVPSSVKNWWTLPWWKTEPMGSSKLQFTGWIATLCNGGRITAYGKFKAVDCYNGRWSLPWREKTADVKFKALVFCMELWSLPWS